MLEQRVASAPALGRLGRAAALAVAGVRVGENAVVGAETLKAEVPRGVGRCVFRKAGSRWRVIFDGGSEFDLEDTLGARRAAGLGCEQELAARSPRRGDFS